MVSAIKSGRALEVGLFYSQLAGRQALVQLAANLVLFRPTCRVVAPYLLASYRPTGTGCTVDGPSRSGPSTKRGQARTQSAEQVAGQTCKRAVADKLEPHQGCLFFPVAGSRRSSPVDLPSVPLCIRPASC